MDINNLSSGTYIIKEGVIQKQNRSIQIELIKEAGTILSETEKTALAAEMGALFQSQNWVIQSESFLFSIRRASRIILLRKDGELAGSFFAGKRKLWNLFDFYYTERLILRKDVPRIMMFFLIALLLYSLPEFLRKPIRAVTLTRLKIVQQLLTFFGHKSITSVKDWPSLPFWQKWMVRGLVDASIGEYYSHKLNEMFDKGVIKNIFSSHCSHDGNKAIIPELTPFSEKDVLLVMSIIPKKMNVIINDFKNNKNISRMRFLRQFMDRFEQGNLFETMKQAR